MKAMMLVSVLLVVSVFGFLTFIVLILRKRENKRYDKISAIATFLTSITTVVVGIATIVVALNNEKRDTQLNQPLFSIEIVPEYSVEKSLFFNEEYKITNEGKKTKNKTDVTCYSFIEVTYTYSLLKSTVKLIPLSNYFGANIYTNSLDGVIQYSKHSGNNRELFYNLYQEALH